jgi:MFS family permease
MRIVLRIIAQTIGRPNYHTLAQRRVHGEELHEVVRFQADTSGQRIGPFWFTPGWTRGNAVTVWCASLLTISLAAFMSFTQSYVLTEMVHVPKAGQGTITGALATFQEIVVVLLAGFVGTFSDRVGRRPVYVVGFLLVAAGYAIFPLASSVTDLFIYRIVFALGIATVPLMLSACMVDATQEVSRGRWVGTNNLLQGLGVVLMSLVLAKTPGWYANLGHDPVTAGRYAFWTVASITLVAAAIMAIGLPRVVPNRVHGRRGSMLGQIRRAWGGASGNPRMAFAYGAAFIGRGDFTVIGYFFPLWAMQHGLASGMSAGASMARGGMLFGLIQGAAMVWAPVMGIISDRTSRVTGLCIALALAMIGYGLLGTVGDLFAQSFIPIALLVGIGEVSVIVASGALVGQEARAQDRGPIIGFYNAVGGVGILFASLIGGIVFDRIGSSAPFVMMAVLNGVLLAFGLAVRARSPLPQRYDAAR